MAHTRVAAREFGDNLRRLVGRAIIGNDDFRQV